jgi:hypothetical protein
MDAMTQTDRSETDGTDGMTAATEGPAATDGTDATDATDGTGATGQMRGDGGDDGMATAEYAVATLAAVGFAGLLFAVLRSGEVQELLLELVRRALSSV